MDSPRIIALTQIQVHPQQDSEGLGHHDDRVAKVGEVDHEQRQGGHGGEQELMPPAQVQYVISKAQENHTTDGQQGTNQLDKLMKTEGVNINKMIGGTVF